MILGFQDLWGFKIWCLRRGREDEEGTDQTYVMNAAILSPLSALRPQLGIWEDVEMKVRGHLIYLHLFLMLSVQVLQFT